MKIFRNQTIIGGKEAMKKGAVISECEKYRYKLWRIWDETKPLILWVMLNPSTADATEDDPTIKKLIRLTKLWGYGGFYVGNVFPYRATNPKELKKVGFEIAAKEENWQHLREMNSHCQLRILAHGNPPIKTTNIKTMFDDWHCLKITNSGNPYHPLYLKEDIKPFSYTL